MLDFRLSLALALDLDKWYLAAYWTVTLAGLFVKAYTLPGGSQTLEFSAICIYPLVQLLRVRIGASPVCSYVTCCRYARDEAPQLPQSGIRMCFGHTCFPGPSLVPPSPNHSGTDRRCYGSCRIHLLDGGIDSVDSTRIACIYPVRHMASGGLVRGPSSVTGCALVFHNL